MSGRGLKKGLNENQTTPIFLLGFGKERKRVGDTEGQNSSGSTCQLGPL